jgi:hypothetical protein
LKLFWSLNADLYGYPDIRLGFFVDVVYVFNCNGGLGSSWNVGIDRGIERTESLIEPVKVEFSPVSILSAVVLSMLAIVSGGVVYLTLAEWRDRRRLDEEKRKSRR